MQGENYKDVIISQPPAMYGNNNNVSLENFKGILLCEKPSLSGFAAPKDPKAFIPSNPTGNPLGYGPTDEDQQRRERHENTRAGNSKLHRNQNRQYLSRHKKWLFSFAKQMKKMKEDEIEHEVEMARRAARFREAAGRRREDQRAAVERPDPYDIQEVQTQLSKSGKGKKKAAAAAAAAPPKPKWAMTEEEAFLADDEDTEGLLDFAKKLDYDKFITDYTIAEALNVMRDRVAEIAKANHWTEDDILRAAEQEDEDDLQSAVPPEQFQQFIQKGTGPAVSRKPVPGSAAAHDQDWDSSTRGQLLKRAISQDALALADRILENTPSMLKVHTRQSLARVLQKCAMNGGDNASVPEAIRKNAELGNMASSELAAATAIGPTIEAAPTTVKISAESTALEQPPRRILLELQNSKEKTQNLPYLYRCPAI